MHGRDDDASLIRLKWKFRYDALSALRAGFGKSQIIKKIILYYPLSRQGNHSQLVDKCHNVVSLVNLSFTVYNSQFGVNDQL